MNDTFQNHRKVHILFLVLPVLLLLSAFGCRSRATNTNSTTKTVNTTTTTTINTPGGTTVDVNPTGGPGPQPQSVTERELSRLAAAFAERYGSYSNQTDYENLEALYVFMTQSLQDATRAFVSDERDKQRDTSIYYGITARAASVKTQSLDEGGGTAGFLVSTFRKETIGSSGNVKTFQEELVVKMRKDGGAWRVDQTVWQGRR